MTEFFPEHLGHFNVSAADFLKLIEEYGFSISDINESTKGVEPVTREQLFTAYNTRKRN